MRIILALTGALVVMGTTSFVTAQTHTHASDHRLYTPQEIPWTPGPPSLPRGSEVAVLYGDPAKEGPFVMRLRFPASYRIPAHRHPGAEILTVISGVFVLGMGETADPAKTRPLTAGSFTAMPGGMAHFAHTDEATVVQLNSVGPWTITYIDPSEDPRRQPR
jgi:quercetin dioxygenase-like cupin family protein